MGNFFQDLHLERDKYSRFPDETCDGFGNDTAFLSPGPALDQHFQIERFGCQAFKGVLTDSPETLLIHVLKQTLFQIGVTKPACVIVSKYALHMSGREQLAYNIKNRIVIQGVPYFLELVQEPLQDTAFDGVCCHEVKNQAVLSLTVAMDAAHALLEAIGIPGDVVVEKDIADLKVDSFPCRFGGDEHLDRTVSELLLRVETCTGIVSGARFHAAMDKTYLKSPCLELFNEVVECVLELGKKE